MVLDYENGLKLMREYDKPFVKLDPRGKPKTSHQHFGRGQLVGAYPNYAMVKPFKHNVVEKIDWEYVKLWRSRTPNFVPVFKTEAPAPEKKETVMQQVTVSYPTTQTPAPAAVIACDNEDVREDIDTGPMPIRPIQPSADVANLIIFNRSTRKFWCKPRYTTDKVTVRWVDSPEHASRYKKVGASVALAHMAEKAVCAIVNEEEAMERYLYPSKFPAFTAQAKPALLESPQLVSDQAVSSLQRLLEAKRNFAIAKQELVEAIEARKAAIANSISELDVMMKEIA